jgi:hypothetical protein
MKLATADATGLNSPSSLFATAMTAGVPAAALVTPGRNLITNNFFLQNKFNHIEISIIFY